MGALRNIGFALFLIGGLATAQQKADRIICTPPTVEVVKIVKPSYPSEAKIRGITQFVVAVEVVVDKAGKPRSIKVLKGDEVLARAVVEAVRKWRWRPLKLNGVPVEVESTVTVHFEPR